MILNQLKLTIETNTDKNLLYVRNLLKEQLQGYVLNFVYNSNYGENFLLKGGSCLRLCFDLPRLSEDIDFDIENFAQFDRALFCQNLQDYFRQKLKFNGLEIKIGSQERIIYLKFPVLKEIGFPISKEKENILFLRLDLAPILGQGFKKEITMKSAFDFSFLIHRYSLEDLFAGKILAIIKRETWEGETKEPRFKGRDFFDFFWLLEKKVEPNFGYLESIAGFSKTEATQRLRQKLLEAINRKEELKTDLQPFFLETAAVENFVNNLEALNNNPRLAELIE